MTQGRTMTATQNIEYGFGRFTQEGVQRSEGVQRG